MKHLLIFLVVTGLSADLAVSQNSFRYLDADSWVADVESSYLRTVPIKLGLQFDRALVRDWIVNCLVPRPAPPHWERNGYLYEKLQALVGYGAKEDLAKVDQLIGELHNGGYNSPEIPLYRLAFLARHGDEQAMNQLLDAPSDVVVWVLPYCQNQACRDRLARIGADNEEDFSVRHTALAELCVLGDRRGFDLGLTREFMAAIHNTRIEIAPGEVFFWMTGFDELLGIIDPDKAWAIIKEKKLLPMPTRKKSVRGPIDWSKYQGPWKLTPTPTAMPTTLPKPPDHAKPAAMKKLEIPRTKPVSLPAKPSGSPPKPLDGGWSWLIIVFIAAVAIAAVFVVVKLLKRKPTDKTEP